MTKQRRFTLKRSRPESLDHGPRSKAALPESQGTEQRCGDAAWFQNKRLSSWNGTQLEWKTVNSEATATHTDDNCKRRIIIWSDEIGRTDERGSHKRLEELIRIIKDLDSEAAQWKPHYYLLSGARNSKYTEIYNSMKENLHGEREAGAHGKARNDCKQLQDHIKLSEVALEGQLECRLKTRSDPTETIMIMTASKKEDFEDLVKTIPNTTAKFKKSPFVALLKMKSEGPSWRSNCSLDLVTDWEIEKLLGCEGADTFAPFRMSKL